VCPPYPADVGEWGCVLEVFDFNVHSGRSLETDHTRMDMNHGQVEDSRSSKPSSSFTSSSSSPSSPTIAHEVSYTIHTEPSTISVSDVFVHDVISKLPYTRTVRKGLCAMYSGFMIDDERIVGLKVGITFPARRTLPWAERSSQASPDGEIGDIDVFVF
jgi:hypothetical protein